MQVVDELDDPVLRRAGDGDQVEHRQVLHQFAQADTARVRADGDAELRGQQQDRDVLVDAADAGGVDLQDVERPRLQQLLEDDAVLDVLPRGDLDRAHPAPDRRVPQDVVGARGFLDPPGVVRREPVDPVDRHADVPALVGVDRDADLGPDGLAGEAEAAHVVLDVRPDLELDLGEPLRDRLVGQPDELLVGVPQPAGGRGVSGEPALQQFRAAGGPARFGAAQELQRLLAGQGVGEVAEVDEVDELLGGHAGQQVPQRQPGALGLEVPQGVDDGGDRHVHDALLRSQPAQLGVVDEGLRRGAHVGEDGLDVAAEEVPGEGVDGGHLHVVAAADGEREPVPLEAVGVVGADDEVGRGVVRVGVHGVGPVEVAGGREPHVVGREPGEPAHHAAPIRWRIRPSPSISHSTTCPARR